MYIKKFKDCPEFTAGDHCFLREFLNPLKDKALQLRYSLAHAIVKPGQTTVLHALKTSEVYYIIEGSGLMMIDHEKEKVGPGDTIYIPPLAKQRITNTGKTDLKFICMVDPAWRPEDEMVLE